MDGLNIISRLQLPLGTSVAARYVVDALQRRGVKLAMYSVDSEVRGRTDAALTEYPVTKNVGDLVYSHTLCMDSIVAYEKMYNGMRNFLTTQRYATVVYWEIDRIPREWQANFRKNDVLYAPSHFIQHTLESTLRKNAVHLPVTPLLDKYAIVPSMQSRPFTFFLHFDLMSTLVRKNPWGIVTAFQEAFGQRDDVRLRIKVWESEGFSLDRAQLQQRLNGHRNIEFIYGDYTTPEVLQFVADCDVYVSLHRGEGLGLGLLEAMSFGKPVIATDFGGIRDFVTSEAGMLVPFSFVPVESHQDCYSRASLGEQGYWADPVHAHAVAAMRRLADDRANYQRLATGARQAYERRKASFLSLDWLNALGLDGPNTQQAPRTIFGDIPPPATSAPVTNSRPIKSLAQLRELSRAC